MSVDDAGVKDRWSRYIGVMGIEAVRKQATAQVLISGLDGLGVEIAKNITLSGVKRLTLHDKHCTSYEDLSSQFFLTQDDIGKNRAECCLNKLQELNFYVRLGLLEMEEGVGDEKKNVYWDKELPTSME
jgi:molybdopterin/thiamine biosynthesis adenylyltransferase